MRINELSKTELSKALSRCCSSLVWLNRLLVKFPVADEQQLLDYADQSWQGLDEADYLQAFAGHPKIGDMKSLQDKYAATTSQAAVEQSAMAFAGEDTVKMLMVGNRAYEKKFGFIFIVCATGKSADEMLGLLEQRLGNDREVELNNAAREQAAITRLRLLKLIED